MTLPKRSSHRCRWRIDSRCINHVEKHAHVLEKKMIYQYMCLNKLVLSEQQKRRKKERKKIWNVLSHLDVIFFAFFFVLRMCNVWILYAYTSISTYTHSRHKLFVNDPCAVHTGVTCNGQWFRSEILSYWRFRRWQSN